MDTFNQKRASCTGLRRPPEPYRHRGLSLVELMVSIAVGLMLVAGITTLIAQQSSSSAELQKASRQIENGRYATQVLRDDIALAGYFGEFFSLQAPTALPLDACATTEVGLLESMRLPIQGFDSPATPPAELTDCIADGNHLAGTDILIVRRADTEAILIADAIAGQPYLQTGLNVSKELVPIVGTGPDTDLFTLKKRDGSDAPLRRFLTHIYFISPCHVPASGTTCDADSDNGNPTPTLKRLELTVAGGTTVPLAEGIENLQIDYGIDADADGAPESYITGTDASGTTEMTAENLGNVMALRLSLLARSLDTSPGHKDTKSYKLGATDISEFEDGYKRRVFTEVVRVVNPSGRRSP